MNRAMDSNKAVAKIETQMKSLETLTFKDLDDAFYLWRKRTHLFLEKIYGESSKEVQSFQKVGFKPIVIPTLAVGGHSHRTPISEQEKIQAFNRGKKKMLMDLSLLSDSITDYGLPTSAFSVYETANSIETVKRICARFHHTVHALQNRYDKRGSFLINDEYDVQDLLRALLVLHFDDVRPEETAPSVAGKRPRPDFLLKREQIVIEVKKTRPSSKEGSLGDELLADIGRYKDHPDCKILICFVYDPARFLRNPTGLVDDLSKSHGGLEVIVIINQS